MKTAIAQKKRRKPWYFGYIATMFFGLCGIASCGCSAGLDSSGHADSPGTEEQEADPPNAPVESEPSTPKPRDEAVQLTSDRKASGFLTSSYKTVLLSAQGVWTPLPEAQTWRELAPRAGYTGLSHPGTESELWIRLQPARRTVSVSECFELGRRRFSELRVPLTETYERRVATEDGYAGLARWGRGPEEESRLLVHLVAPSRCLSLLFMTKRQEGAPLRMQVILERVATGLRVRDLDHRVAPTRP